VSNMIEMPITSGTPATVSHSLMF